MHDRVKMILEVNPLAEAVGADKNSLMRICELENTTLTLGGRKPTSDSCHLNLLRQLFSELGCDVLGSRDKATKEDWSVTIFKEFLYKFYCFDKLLIFVPMKSISLPGHP